MSFDKQLIADALTEVRVLGGDAGGPEARGAAGDAASRVRHIAACDGHAALRLSGTGLEPAEMDTLAAACHEAIVRRCQATGERLIALVVELLDGTGSVFRTVRFGNPAAPAASAAPGSVRPPAPAGQNQGQSAQGSAPGAGKGHQPISGLRPAEAESPKAIARTIIAVGAGKGGVGKSSIAVNLAVGLARKGHAVGLMDGDIYGPSMPTMLGLHHLEQVVMGGSLQPFYVHGVKAITIGKLVDPDRPLIWRGPMAHGAFKQLIEQTEWGGGDQGLDYLIIDLPPGTGDVSLTMSQMLKLTGAVVVCTPQRVAQDDAVRAVRMFQQLGIEVLGIVENMSSFFGDDGKEYDIFGKGGAQKMAQRLNLPFLGMVPITMALRENSDRGDPSANFREGTPLARSLEDVVANIERQAALAAVRQGQSKPTLKIS
jgi:ATP-binding protein involved in chromosome partitioning